MNSSHILLNLILSGCLLLIGGCEYLNLSPKSKSLQVVYIQQICCGNLSILNEETILSCDSYEDFLLQATNLEDFDIPQLYQFGDTLTIEYELAEGCEASCDITCNRMNGIPIRLMEVK